MGSGTWKHGGTFCFDTVAAAHVFPEYFWIGQGYGRYLAWGIFEGAGDNAVFTNLLAPTPDERLMTRKRIHVTRNPRTAPVAYDFADLDAQHYDHSATNSQSTKWIVKEYTTSSWYNDTKGDTLGLWVEIILPAIGFLMR